jgi:uncharacterized protein (TIGR02246 family)
MPPTTPEQVHLVWLEATNAGDIDTVMSLYEPDSAIVDPDGNLVDGHDAVRKVTEGLLQLGPQFDLRVARVLRCGDVALLLSPWTMTGISNGTPMKLQGTTTDLVRRQPDGTWLFVIDNPTGIDILGADTSAR